MSLIRPNFVINFIYFQVSHAITPETLLNKCNAMNFVLLPKLIILISVEVPCLSHNLNDLLDFFGPEFAISNTQHSS